LHKVNFYLHILLVKLGLKIINLTQHLSKLVNKIKNLVMPPIIKIWIKNNYKKFIHLKLNLISNLLALLNPILLNFVILLLNLTSQFIHFLSSTEDHQPHHQKVRTQTFDKKIVYSFSLIQSLDKILVDLSQYPSQKMM
jgi:hypothetical protein